MYKFSDSVVVDPLDDSATEAPQQSATYVICTERRYDASDQCQFAK